MKTLSILTAGIAILLPTVASAHDTSPLYRELARQSSLIDSGRRSGDLNHQEVRKLEDEQTYIRSLLSDALYDGTVTRGEYRSVESALADAKYNIRRETNNDHVAYWRVRGGSVSGEDELGYPRELSRDGQAQDSGWGRGWGRGWSNRWGWGYGRRQWN